MRLTPSLLEKLLITIIHFNAIGWLTKRDTYAIIPLLFPSGENWIVKSGQFLEDENFLEKIIKWQFICLAT